MMTLSEMLQRLFYPPLHVLNDTGNDIAPTGLVKVICVLNVRKKQVNTINTINEWRSVGIQMLQSYNRLYKYIKSNYNEPQRKKK